MRILIVLMLLCPSAASAFSYCAATQDKEICALEALMDKPEPTQSNTVIIQESQQPMVQQAPGCVRVQCQRFPIGTIECHCQ